MAIISGVPIFRIFTVNQLLDRFFTLKHPKILDPSNKMALDFGDFLKWI